MILKHLSPTANSCGYHIKYVALLNYFRIISLFSLFFFTIKIHEIDFLPIKRINVPTKKQENLIIFSVREVEAMTMISPSLSAASLVKLNFFFR
uniref:Uncharacterized protein n=1 Tax=Octopus bimaculoides TaxID=37653 RepID=A0A0L8I2D8_OCTBM